MSPSPPPPRVAAHRMSPVSSCRSASTSSPRTTSTSSSIPATPPSRVCATPSRTSPGVGAAARHHPPPPPAAATTVNSYIIELPRNQAEILTALLTDPPPNPPIVLKYVLRPQAEWGKRDGTNGFDKPNYESNVGTALTPGADTTVT